ncbi:helix-turn-helix domain-containing protein [Carnobacterium pleistocenium]|uniref:helix-turn-helix domain-containing protein n=1 Tax=Carnobacterium pleistocenium TaxID=181073 RepID=UPI000556F4B9|nr:helix-turn-helix transcriptional regulator [Carnobacterium pleistocenium]
MTQICQKFGEDFKKIRENKNYTQQYVANGAMARSTYTKFETGSIVPTITKYFEVLNNLDMSHEEFNYIHNHYHLEGKGAILYQFRAIAVNSDLNNLINVKETTMAYLDEHKDNVVQDIFNICNALIILSKTNDLTQAAPFAAKVWHRIAQLDKWYLTELHLLNNILFFFDFDTSLLISKRALVELENYNHFHEATELKLAYTMNLIYLLMENRNYNQALERADSLIILSKKNGKYRMLGVLYVRKGIILAKLNKADSKIWIQKGFNLLEALEDFSLKEELKKEILYYLNHSLKKE